MIRLVFRFSNLYVAAAFHASIVSPRAVNISLYFYCKKSRFLAKYDKANWFLIKFVYKYVKSSDKTNIWMKIDSLCVEKNITTWVLIVF